MLLKQPESHIRPWLKAHGRQVAAYTRQRLEASFRHIPSLLSTCEGLDSGIASAVGDCGSYDTFGIRCSLDGVYDIGTNPSVIEAAVDIARGAGVSPGDHGQRADSVPNLSRDGRRCRACLSPEVLSNLKRGGGALEPL